MRIGPFDVLDTLGVGGAGAVVYRARHEQLGRMVALKQFRRPSGAHTERELERFLREAQAMAAIRSDYVVTLYSYQVLDGRPTLEMEYMEGGSLENVLAEGPIAVPDTLDLLKQVLWGLRDIHALGFVHRDIKPGNILRTGVGRIKIADFGISLQTGAGSGGYRPTMHAGTVQYLAPECLRDPPVVDARADLYAVGMVAYEALLGRERLREVFQEIVAELSFLEDERWIAWAKDAQREAPHLHHLTPDLPAALSLVVARLMAKEPERRPASANEALDELAKFSGYQPTRRFETGGAKPDASAKGQKRDSRDERTDSASDQRQVDPQDRWWVRSWRRVRARSRPPFSESSNWWRRRRRVLIAASVAIVLLAALLLPVLALAIRASWVVVKRNPKDGLEYLWIPAGTFQMGCDPSWLSTLSPQLVATRGLDKEDIDDFRDDFAEWCERSSPRHRVTIPEGLWLGRTEVTSLAFDRFLKATGRRQAATNASDARPGPEEPAIVSWGDAAAYCSWAGGRLSTEAEWEYAAASGRDSTPFPWGSDLPVCDPTAPNGAHSLSCGTKLKTVASYRPTEWGLFDVSGNAPEWTADVANEGYRCSADDGTGTSGEPDAAHVIRGNVAFDDDDTDTWEIVRSLWHREGQDQGERAGFRCVVGNVSRPLAARRVTVPKQEHANLIVKVVDTSGAVLPGVTLELRPANGTPSGQATAGGSEQTVANEAGSFCLGSRAPGEYVLTAQRQGFTPLSRKVVLSRGDAKQERLELVATPPPPPPPPPAAAPNNAALDLDSNEPHTEYRTISPGFQPDPLTISVHAGGSVDMRNQRLGNGCLGWASSQPDVIVDLTGSAERLRFYVTSGADTALIVRNPNGSWRCNDDFGGNRNPELTVASAAAGRYSIWVGNWDAYYTVAATLYISGLVRQPASGSGSTSTGAPGNTRGGNTGVAPVSVPPAPPAPSVARVVVSVDAEVTVTVSGRDIGKLAAQASRLVEVEPGQQLIVAKTAGGELTERVTLELRAGQQQVVQISLAEKLAIWRRDRQQTSARAAFEDAVRSRPPGRTNRLNDAYRQLAAGGLATSDYQTRYNQALREQVEISLKPGRIDTRDVGPWEGSGLITIENVAGQSKFDFFLLDRRSEDQVYAYEVPVGTQPFTIEVDTPFDRADFDEVKCSGTFVVSSSSRRFELFLRLYRTGRLECELRPY